jgi:hypothetical protein
MIRWYRFAWIAVLGRWSKWRSTHMIQTYPFGKSSKPSPRSKIWRSRERSGRAHRKKVDGEVLAHWSFTARWLRWFLVAMEYVTAFSLSRRRRRCGWGARALPVTRTRGSWSSGHGHVEQSVRQKRWTGMDLGNEIHTEASRGRGRASGEIWRVEVLGAFGNRSSELRMTNGEIRSRLLSLFWCTIDKRMVSGSCVTMRYRWRCRKEIRRGSRFTGILRCSLAEVAARRSWLGQPSGDFKLGFRGERVRRRGGGLWASWLGRGARNRSEIEGGSVEIFQVLDVFIPNSSNGMIGASLLSAAKRMGARYRFRNEVSGSWAVFLPGPKGYPAAFSSFSFSFLFSFLFSFEFCLKTCK